MHPANRAWWRHCARRYRSFFRASRVIEFGSMNVNGSVRDFFRDPISYIGVDWRKGPNVDVVGLAHEVELEPADTVISCSMLEHDPYWKRSIQAMVRHMKPDAGLFLSWGATYNAPHCHGTAPDGKFHPLASSIVLAQLRDLGLHVHEFRYENQIPGFRGPWIDSTHDLPAGSGEVALVAFLSPRDDFGPPEVMPTLPGD